MKQESGFTLVEALVALSILTVGLLPAFFLAGNSIVLAASVRNAVIATNLAQEGAEVLRALRDNNWFADVPFDTGLTSCASGCRVQWNRTNLLPLGSNPPLLLNEDTGLYQYDTGDETHFRRQLQIESISDHVLRAVITVEWTERSGPRSYAIEYYLYDWLQ